MLLLAESEVDRFGAKRPAPTVPRTSPFRRCLGFQPSCSLLSFRASASSFHTPFAQSNHSRNSPSLLHPLSERGGGGVGCGWQLRDRVEFGGACPLLGRLWWGRACFSRRRSRRRRLSAAAAAARGVFDAVRPASFAGAFGRVGRRRLPGASLALAARLVALQLFKGRLLERTPGRLRARGRGGG